MQRPDRSEATIESQPPPQQHGEDIPEIQPPGGQAAGLTSHNESSSTREIDWLALGVVLLIAGLFALCGRVNPQPATSLVPVAVLSATGCGLLVTAVRKLHTFHRPGLREAAIAGLFLALFQFVVALSYPNVMYALSQATDQKAGFLYTWVLIGIFSVIGSIAGAAIGHLAFAPPRPLPAKQRPIPTPPDHTFTRQAAGSAAGLLHRPSHIGYLIAVVLFGFAPMLVGYVFAAAFDYMLQVNLYFAGPYPTLRLLGTLLPWQVPIPFTPVGKDPNALIFLLWRVWRIPLFLGNPTMFDIQALEPYVFNGAALALLLITASNAVANADQSAAPPPSPAPRWPALLLLETCLGLLLVSPADLLIVRGLLGLLQNQILALPIRTLSILNPLTFTLNLIFGPLVCAGIGSLLYAWVRGRRPAKQVTLQR